MCAAWVMLTAIIHVIPKKQQSINENRTVIHQLLIVDSSSDQSPTSVLLRVQAEEIPQHGLFKETAWIGATKEQRPRRKINKKDEKKKTKKEKKALT